MSEKSATQISVLKTQQGETVRQVAERRANAFSNQLRDDGFQVVGLKWNICTEASYVKNGRTLRVKERLLRIEARVM